MALTDNYGTQYYGISCGIPSDAGLDVNINYDTRYYRNSANEFILWGQETQYTHVQANTGSQYYFLKCSVPSDAGVDLTRNYGTNYYYSSAFNCVSWCDAYTIGDGGVGVGPSPGDPPEILEETNAGTLNILGSYI